MKTIGHDTWMQIQGGAAFDLLNPQPSDVKWPIVARATSRIGRFGTHTEGKRIYSVAQHELEGAEAIMRERGDKRLAAIFLIHDAHEFVIGDIVKPVEKALMAHAGHAGNIVKRAVARLKNTVDFAIFGAAGIPYPLSPDDNEIIKEYDIRMCRTERDAIMAPCEYAWTKSYADAQPICGCDFYPWDSNTAAALYEAACYDLLPALSVDNQQTT